MVVEEEYDVPERSVDSKEAWKLRALRLKQKLNEYEDIELPEDGMIFATGSEQRRIYRAFKAQRVKIEKLKAENARLLASLTENARAL